ncbi:hypothetical protein DH2020_015949 [Rehmannia glutinosa]|uniref:C3H1-type domain-containing protein n=1 Tax=Rehmannia glutinosa TaxID=99300 RepID=A0ABR0WXC2_REHGL
MFHSMLSQPPPPPLAPHRHCTSLEQSVSLPYFAGQLPEFQLLLLLSLFQNYSPTSLSDTASFDGGGDTERRLHDASSVLEYQQLYNRYALCLSQLRESIEEVDALRSENDSLRLSNADLSHRVALLFSRDRLLSEFHRLNIATPSAAPAPLPVRAAHPQPLTEAQSLRSEKYRTRAKKEEEALELDVYNQGMLKTELCNKWQETGTCPYGENCQFAHGIKELRPVIRHPRYKTEERLMATSSLPTATATTLINIEDSAWIGILNWIAIDFGYCSSCMISHEYWTR